MAVRFPLAMAIENLRRIVGASDLPVTVDLEGGYGDTPEMAGETIGLAIAAGAVGCNLEDSFPQTGNSARQLISAYRIRTRGGWPMLPIRASSSMPGLTFFFSGRPNSMTMIWSQKLSYELALTPKPALTDCLHPVLPTSP